MNKSELDKLHKSVATDFKITARKTELWRMAYCYDILHDIKRLMMFGYLETVSLVLNDHNNIPSKAKKYVIGTTQRSNDDRPGNIDWEDGEGKALNVILMYSPKYHALAIEERYTFQRDNLKIPWGSSAVDTNFPHLRQSLSKMYTHESHGINRVDFN